MNHEQIFSQLGLAGAILFAVVYLLREIRKLQPPPPLPLPPAVPKEGKGPTIHPTSNGRVQRLEDRTEQRFERMETKIENQSEQLESLSRGQFETRALVERQGGKLDAILEGLKSK